MKILGIIPARYNSQRLPGKPLIEIGGKTMIQRVYEQAMKSSKLDKVIVATDDENIYNHVKDFGGIVEMTSVNHRNGTERCAEVANKYKLDYDYIVNIQGDEPFIDPIQIDELCEVFSDPKTEVATILKKIKKEDELFDDKEAKVVFNSNNEVLYTSRSPIPCLHNIPKNEWLKKHDFYMSLGLYGFKSDVLIKLAAQPASELEIKENLEQLRWLEYNTMKVAFTETDCFSIDTPEDLIKAEEYL